MPCWPEVWDYARRVLPLLGGVVAYVAVLGFLLWAPVIHRRWLRNTLRLLGVLGLIPAGLVFFALLLTGGLPGQGVPEEKRIIQSPDGQVATLIYQAGFLGRDHTEVTLKRAGCCRHIRVFWHAGPSTFHDPKVDWPDNRHLRIVYHARVGDADQCESHLADIAIVCKAEDWDWDTASPRVPQP
jgi:hypothetical protein